MSEVVKTRMSDMVQKHQADLLKEWVAMQLSATTLRSDLMKESTLREQSGQFLNLFQKASQSGNVTDLSSGEWTPVKDFLSVLSTSRAKQGFSSSETATFVFSLKQPIFNRLRQEYANDVQGLATDLWHATTVLDNLGLMTTESYQAAREEVISRQQQELLELSTPVVRLWEGVLALPLIGTLDSERTQVVMQNLLQKIVETGSAISIIDITGVPVVDTLVAQHLLKTVAAARLMGADCIISGIRPQIAQTIVHLGVDLKDVITKSTLADALAVAFQRTGFIVRKSAGKSDSSASAQDNGMQAQSGARSGRDQDL